MSRLRRGFAERSIASLAEALEHALAADESARAPGLLQSLDARVKLAGIVALIVAAAMARRLWVLAALLAISVALAALSRVSFRVLAKRVWIVVFVFTALIALPAPFITPGRTVAQLPLLGWPVSAAGLTSAAYLILRVETAATFSALLVLSTPWGQLLKALRVLRTPVVLVVILGVTYRYVFLLLQSAVEMFESRQSRMVGALSGADRRRVAASTAGVLMSKSLQLSSEVYSAMLSRGFSGEVYSLSDFEARRIDWLALAAFGALTAAALWLGR
ncbi:MAG: cobalt ECF transporter T component CbiQ [Terriglobia bacterium]